MQARPFRRVFALALCLSTPIVHLPAQEDGHVFTREDVLGTTARMTLRARTGSEARKLEADVLREIDRLAAIVSTWDSSSELARALSAAKPVVLSAECAEVIAACEAWRERSHGAFHPGVGTLTALWAAAAKSGRAPDAATLRAATAALDGPAWNFDPKSRRFSLRPGAQVRVDALAKGWILERASAVARNRWASVLVLDIGGDVRVRSEEPRPIAIADPRKPADNAAPLTVIWLTDGAIASSGGYARGFDVAGEHHTHVLDPRTGLPCDTILGATVIARDGATADALATILDVLGPTDGLALVEGIEGAAGLVVTADGEVHTSEAWSSFTTQLASTTAAVPSPGPRAPVEPQATPDGSVWPDHWEFNVDVEIRDPAADGGGRRRGGYERPYVAVWIETPSGEAVRTLALWIERPKWLPDLRRWSRLHRTQGGFVDAISRATRKPGSYTLAWDGRDDAGNAMAPGEYVLLIEATREHGTYQIMRQPIEVGSAPFSHEIAGNAEIGRAAVRFGEKKQT